MATKSSLISAVNGFITSVVNITKHRNSMLEVINELYGNQLSDTQLTTNVITRTFFNTSYNLTFTKTGRMVHVYGTIINNSDDIFENMIIADITNAEFAPQGGQQFRIDGFSDLDNDNIPFIFENTTTPKIRGKEFPLSKLFYINGFYLTNQ